MMGDFLTSVSIMILGYAYPAYQCYKIVELNRPRIEQLLFWCQYWILVAVMAVFERVGDPLISWFPLYGEFKLLFFVYLWHPKTKGTTYIYNTFFQPYMSRHENKIDRTLLELRSQANDLAARYWQNVLSNGWSWFLPILPYGVSQPSSTTLHPVEDDYTRLVDSQHVPAESVSTSSTEYSNYRIWSQTIGGIEFRMVYDLGSQTHAYEGQSSTSASFPSSSQESAYVQPIAALSAELEQVRKSQADWQQQIQAQVQQQLQAQQNQLLDEIRKMNERFSGRNAALEDDGTESE